MAGCSGSAVAFTSLGGRAAGGDIRGGGAPLALNVASASLGGSGVSFVGGLKAFIASAWFCAIIVLRGILFVIGALVAGLTWS